MSRSRALAGRGTRPTRRRRAGRRRSSPDAEVYARARARRCATTSTRTASSTWCSGSRAGSTRRSSRCVAVDALGPGARDVRVDALALLLARAPRSDARALAGQPRRRAAASCRSSGAMERLRGAARRAVRRHASRTSPRRTCRRASAATCLMALSNKFGWLVLTTGNKSEMSVGYSTLYGDMAGGFAVIKDVPKTLVYRLVRWRNAQAGRELIPAVDPRAPALGRAAPRPARRRTRCRPTTCSTRSSRATSRRTSGREQLIAPRAAAEDVVDRVIRLVDRAEYKRRQAPPGIKITPQGLRPRPAAADHEPLRELGGFRRSAPQGALAGRTAIVTRDAAHRRPSSSVKSTSQTQVVRPRWIGRALGVDHALGDRAQEDACGSTGRRRSCRRPRPPCAWSAETIDSASAA